MDKKTFRVTNEQAKAFKDCSDCPDSRNCHPTICAAFDICNDPDTNLFNVSSDLLEARDLIKEMREVMHATRNTYSEELLPYAKSRLDEIIEKTKDYA